MAIQPNKHEEMLFCLLRASLRQEKADTTLFESATKEDWLACYKLACSQSVVALALDGIVTLPKELQPFLDLNLSWKLVVSALEKNYQHYCETAIELSEAYSAHHIRTLVLKGVGLSTIYPKPQHREGGDIDIYTYSADTAIQSHEAAHKLANQLIADLHVEVKRVNDKHSVFTYQNVPVENHRTFLDVTEWPFAIDVEKELQQRMHPVEISLLPDQPKILVPSTDFNLLFIATHTLRHYCVGMNLHHLCDWACLIRQYGTKVPKLYQDPRYTRIFNLFTGFTNRYLGTEVAITENTSDVDDLFYQLFRSPFRNGCKSKMPLKIFIYRIRRFFRYRSVLKRLIGEPFWSSAWMLFKTRVKL